MFTLGGGAKVFLVTGATDLRRGFSLYTLIEHQLGFSQPLNGDVFVFINRRRDLLKLFWFSEGGMCVLGKRLQTGTFFRWPQAGEKTVTMTAAQLQLLLSGIDLTKTRARKWWRPPTAQSALQAAGGSAEDLAASRARFQAAGNSSAILPAG
jgi:transposase